MAEKTGADVIIQVLDAVNGLAGHMDRFETRMDRLGTRMEQLETRMERMETRLDRMETRMGDQADALMLVAANVQRLTTVVKNRIDDHEQRLQRLEQARTTG